MPTPEADGDATPSRRTRAARCATRTPCAADVRRGRQPDPAPSSATRARSSTCIYIIKENRTYDQVFGDMKEGNGDPELCLFPEAVTPNHHKLAREFVLLDNFYVDGEVSADGHEWTMGAYATDFVEKIWPLSYRGGEGLSATRARGTRTRIARPSGGYLWDKCTEAKVSYRTYGEWIENGEEASRTARSRTASRR